MPKKHRKGLIIISLMQTILAVITLALVGIFVIKPVAEAAFFQSATKESAEKLSSALSSPGEGQIKILLSFEEGDAVIGFSKNSKEFLCTNCQRIYSVSEAEFQTPPTYAASFIKKPQTKECASTSCLCSCQGISIASDGFEMKCKKMTCRSLKQDLLDEGCKFKASASFFSEGAEIEWKNGLLFGSSSDIKNGLSNKESRQEVWINRINKAGSFQSIACPPEALK